MREKDKEAEKAALYLRVYDWGEGKCRKISGREM